jgi:hypothetical protein
MHARVNKKAGFFHAAITKANEAYNLPNKSLRARISVRGVTSELPKNRPETYR